MRLDGPHVFETRDKKIRLVAETFEEPNPGNTFWKFKFYIDNNLVVNNVLDYEKQGLFTNLSAFRLESLDGEYVYIPKYKPVIYNVKTKEFKEFEAALKEGDNSFVKNYFYENQLIIVYRSAIVMIELGSGSLKSYDYSSKSIYIEDVKHNTNKEIEMEYRDLKAYEFKKKIIKM